MTHHEPFLKAKTEEHSVLLSEWGCFQQVGILSWDPTVSLGLFVIREP